MKGPRNRKILWVALGTGLVAFAVGAALAMWAVGGPDEPSTTRTNLPATDTAVLSESVQLETSSASGPGGGGRLFAITHATVSDYVELDLRASQAPPPAPQGGGQVERSQVDDSVQFIIRDSSGRIKQQGAAR